MLTQQNEAEFIAYALWAAIFLIVFQPRLYYLGFLLVVVLAAGASALEFAPALWVPVEFVLGGVEFFRDVRDTALGKRAAGVAVIR